MAQEVRSFKVRPTSPGIGMVVLHLSIATALVSTLVACAPKAEEKKPAGPPTTLITSTRAVPQTLEVTEDTLGTLESLIDPKIATSRLAKLSWAR